jgi:hypothetical protein
LSDFAILNPFGRLLEQLSLALNLAYEDLLTLRNSFVQDSWVLGNLPVFSEMAVTGENLKATTFIGLNRVLGRPLLLF